MLLRWPRSQKDVNDNRWGREGKPPERLYVSVNSIRFTCDTILTDNPGLFVPDGQEAEMYVYKLEGTATVKKTTTVEVVANRGANGPRDPVRP